MTFKVLLIGCGNIGALYDIDQDNVLTHAKAYFRHPNFNLTVYDQDEDLATRISRKYKVDVIFYIDNSLLNQFDCVSICSPTSTHFHFLKMAFDAKVPVVICEKPVSNNLEELNDLADRYHKGSTKVIVNYMRRFQSDFEKLKLDIADLLKYEKLNHISIRYQRGFLNNCSHALDLLSFIIDKKLLITSPLITESINDHFESDPTLSMSFRWDSIQVHIIGLSNIKFSLFEIELYFEYTRISILEAGNQIKWMTAIEENKSLLVNKATEGTSKKNCLSDYMTQVIELANQLLLEDTKEDNFMHSIELNKLLIKTINK